MRIVALEEAFWVDGLQTTGSFVAQHPPLKPEAVHRYTGRLTDFTEYRLPDMDRHGIDVQVLSLTAPGIQMQPDTSAAVEDAKAANDFLAQIIGQHPGRFAGLAALPLQDPEQAAEELRRAVGDLGLSGALVNDHSLGHRLDEDQYAPVWAELESLGVPLYIHPGAPQPWPVLDGYPELNGAAFGWGATTGGHVMRLIYGGSLRSLPAGHGDPWPHGRIPAISADPFRQPPSRPRHPHAGPAAFAVLRRQREDHDLGVYSHAALSAAIDAIGVENVMFAVDYPYENNKPAVEFLRTAPLDADDLARVAHRNADELLRLATAPSLP